jgi:hypothetical protein
VADAGGTSTAGVRPAQPSDTYDAIKIALAVVAGAGGVVALVVAYRRQHLSETADAREYDKALIERFGAAAEQLGADQAAVRMAGAYAMARLADEWPQERQMCIDVLCGYLRMPHAPDPPPDDAALTAWQRERKIRGTVLHLIGAHLRDDAPQSWQGCDLDFAGAVIDVADFRGARFTGGDIVFVETLFWRTAGTRLSSTMSTSPKAAASTSDSPNSAAAPSASTVPPSAAAGSRSTAPASQALRCTSGTLPSRRARSFSKTPSSATAASISAVLPSPAAR